MIITVTYSSFDTGRNQVFQEVLCPDLKSGLEHVDVLILMSLYSFLIRTGDAENLFSDKVNNSPPVASSLRWPGDIV